MKVAKWASLPILDAFRPAEGWRTDHAVLGTYSADPVALVAILLALAGRDDDRGSGTAVDFADTIEDLRGKVTFLIQSGRISVPVRAQTVLTVLDNFVTEMKYDESLESWHPKVALIRQSFKENREVCWRFWMGSRNFTRDRSWDAGLLLLGTVEKKGKLVPGLIETARELWARAGFSQSDQKAMANELSRVRWTYPPACKVEEITFLLPGTAQRGLPPRPLRLDSLLVVSPFLDRDGDIVEELGKWGNEKTQRILLSTYDALAGLAGKKGDPLRQFKTGDILYMVHVDEDESLPMPNGEENSEETSEDAEEDHDGLHAKLILACGNGRSTLWLGSPNATKRAWEKNFEIVARLSVSEELVVELTNFAKRGRVFEFSDAKPEALSKEKMAIEEAHRQVVTRWCVRQKSWALYADASPHPDNPEVKLEVGILGGEFVTWPRETKVVRLLPGEPPVETELVQVRVLLGDFERRWLQKAPLDLPPGPDRDRKAVATMLTPRAFLDWLRAILDDLPAGGEAWDRKGSNRSGQASPERWMPTLEDILKAWTRSPDTLKVLDARMKAYATLIRELSGKDEKEMQLLDEFEKVWKMVRQEFLVQE